MTLEAWASQYDPIFTFRLGPQAAVALTDADLSNQIMRACPDTYRRTSTLTPIFQDLGIHGIFSAEGG